MPYVKVKDGKELLVTSTTSNLKYHFEEGEVKEISEQEWVGFFITSGHFEQVTEEQFKKSKEKAQPVSTQESVPNPKLSKKFKKEVD